ncbi:hypothetical protein GpartN1_g896.t1 [Galdieria partita]|uniref:DC-UbP/UBTD2 N-terminal domain-containing protein n=1 Tax=Galdieria partita TaxID=83374 RepID=A0A9C7PRE1_9RHOD|nr:hypothetical protein GpartN1_g896.t1 [Galdieria partita]
MGNCVGRSTQDTTHTRNGMGGWFKSKKSTSPGWNGIVQQPKPWKAEPPFGPLTETELKRMREEFWDTRTEGRQEMWQALKAAAETTEDTLRNEIVKAAGLTPANREGTLESCYDELGNYYEVPVYCLRDPDNLVRLEEEDNSEKTTN